MTAPNIVLIVADDLGWRDLACFGSSFYETPNLDRLAAGGVRFTDACASCPVCSPTRASILTGRYPARVGITNWIGGNPWGRLMGVPFFDRLPAGETTVADALRAGGYATWHVGKWHLGPEGDWPTDRGFDVNLGGCDWGAPRHGYFSPYHCPTLSDGPDGEYLTDRLTDEAIGLVRGRGEKPFFLHLAHYAVHTPIEAPADLVEKYRRKAAELGLDRVEAIEAGEPMAALHKKDQRVQRRVVQSDPAYAAMVENLDANVGRLLDALEEEGIAGNTLVMFTSDNGGLSTAEGSPTCNRPLLEGKGWLYDGGYRVCQIARWPAVIAAGRTISLPVISTDFFPTFLEAAGLAPMPGQHVDGVSLMPLFRGAEALDREAIFWHYPHYSNQGGRPGCAVRCGDWKLIEHFEDGRLELFNLRQDIGETENRAGEDPHRTQAMFEMLEAWRRSVEAKIPEPNRHYQDMIAGRMPCPDGNGRIPGDDH